MLSPTAAERGTAGELAEALERGVAHGGPMADEPLFEWETQPSSEWTQEEQARSRLLGHRPRHRDRQSALDDEHSASARVTRPEPRTWQPWLAALLALALCPGDSGSVRTGQQIPPPGDTVSLAPTSRCGCGAGRAETPGDPDGGVPT